MGSSTISMSGLEHREPGIHDWKMSWEPSLPKPAFAAGGESEKALSGARGRGEAWVRVFSPLSLLFFLVAIGLPTERVFGDERRSGVEKVEVLWIWSGAVSPTSARVKAKTTSRCEPCFLQVHAESGLELALRFEPSPSVDQVSISSFELEGLSPGTKYEYALEIDGETSEARGSFRTFAEGPKSFRIALSACARTGSDSEVFRTIRQHDPLFFLHMGDFHYENIEKDEERLFLDAYDRVLSSSTQAKLYRSTPVVYVWDDHDYGSNNADRRNPARRAARLAYQRVVPHYGLEAGQGNVPIYQSFVVGRVLFLITDGRSEKADRNLTDDSDKSVLGAEQKAWLKRELLAGRDEAGLIVWVNTFPWIASTKKKADHWGGYSTEREEIARFIQEHGIDNLAMLSGDAHMLAIDDGSNNTYGGADRGFPVFHAGALDSRGSRKGGPYSHGTFPGPGHFGLMEVLDDGDRITVSWSGRDAEDRVILRYRFVVPAP